MNGLPLLVLITSLCLNLIFLGIAVIFVRNRGGVDYVLTRLRLRNSVENVKPPTAWYGETCKLLDALPIRAGDIVFVGDSLTEDAPWSELLDDCRVKNRGVSGEQSQDIVRRAPEIFRAGPAAAFVMMGVNDVQKDVPLGALLGNYRALIDEARRQNAAAKVFVQSILPIRSHEYVLRRIEKANEALQSLATELGTEYIDLHPMFRTADGSIRDEYTWDGIHLTACAYLAWRDAIKAHVASI